MDSLSELREQVLWDYISEHIITIERDIINELMSTATGRIELQECITDGVISLPEEWITCHAEAMIEDER